MLSITRHGDHFDISEKVSAFIHKRFAGLDLYQPEAQSVAVSIRREAGRFQVHAELRGGSVAPIYARALEDTVYAAIKRSSELIRKQLRRRHNKQVSHRDG